MLQCAIGRYCGLREHHPFIRRGSLFDASDSNYEEYVKGNPIIGNLVAWIVNACSVLGDGPYFAPDQNNWNNDRRVGGKQGGVFA